MRRFLHRILLRPAMRWLTGIRIDHPERLPQAGPAIVVANHNSHIDTALLLAAFPTDVVDLVRPAAAADYWFRNRAFAWFSDRVLGAVPVVRSRNGADPLGPASAALSAGRIVVMFPEGTRGDPGCVGGFRAGVVRLAERHPTAVVVPVWLDGCEQVMPRHGRLPRRATCEVHVGDPLSGRVLADLGAEALRRRVLALA